MIEENKDARTWATLCHLSALLVLLGLPLGNVFGPLVAWLIKRNEHPFVDDQGKEALNFQISMTVYGIVAGMFMAALFAWSFPFFWPFHHGMWWGSPWDFWFSMRMPFTLLVFTFLVMGLFLLDVILAIVAALKASNGERYRYPITIRFVR